MIDINDDRPKTYRIDPEDLRNGIARIYVRYTDAPEDTEIAIMCDGDEDIN